MKKLLFLICFIFPSYTIFAQHNLPLDSIEDCFKIIKSICDKDNGKLWGKSLWSPILVIDRESRMIVANEADNLNLLTKKGSLFVGNFPETSIIANSTTEFGGKLWTMVAYPLPKDNFELLTLFIHEMFHRLQPELGLSNCSYYNSHIDKLEARLYLKLELTALLKAINNKDFKQSQSITDALIFRQYRRSLFPGCDSNENLFEIHEGLADYTAFKLCSKSNFELISAHNARKEMYLNQTSYVRIFGYFTASLYAFLLDEKQTEWIKNLNCNSNLAQLLSKAYKIEIPQELNTAVEKIREKYGYKEILNFELKLKNEKDKKTAVIKDKFSNGKVLKIKLEHAHFGFNPASMQPLDSLGTYFPNIIITDDWGVINVDENGCIMKFGEYVLVPAESIDIKENEISGNGWKLKLDENWKIEMLYKNYFISKK